MDLAKVAVIFNFTTLINVKTLHDTLGHTRYYRHFIRNYASINEPVEKKILNK